MIFKSPTPGDCTEWIMDPYAVTHDAPNPCLYEETPLRMSEVLGPDGEPLMLSKHRRKIGFYLTPRDNRQAG